MSRLGLLCQMPGLAPTPAPTQPDTTSPSLYTAAAVKDFATAVMTDLGPKGTSSSRDSSSWRKHPLATGLCSLIGMFHFGFGMALQGPLLPVLKTTFSESDSNKVISYWFIARSLGGIMGSFIGGKLIDRGHDGRAISICALAIMGVGELAIPLSEGQIILMEAFLKSAGIGMLICCATTFSTWAFDGDTRPINNYNIVAFAVGAATAPHIAVGLDHSGHNILYAYWVHVALVVLSVPLFVAVVPPERPSSVMKDAEQTGGAHSVKSLGAVWWTMVPASGVILFLAIGSTASYMNYLRVWAELSPSDISLQDISTAISFIALIEGTSRFALAYINPKVSAAAGIILGAAFTAVSGIPMFFHPSKVSMFGSAALFGVALPVLEGYVLAHVQETGLMTPLTGSILSAGQVGGNMVCVFVALFADVDAGEGIVAAINFVNIACAGICLAMLLALAGWKWSGVLPRPSAGLAGTDELQETTTEAFWS